MRVTKTKKLAHSRPLGAGVEIIQDISAISQPLEGYLKRYRHRVKTVLTDGSRTDVYVVDFIDRLPHLRDAVGVAIFSRASKNERPGAVRVMLRRQVRYAAFLAVGAPLVTEVVCGLIEAPETPEETSARELWEEAGLEISPSAVRRLGRPTFILPSILTERFYPTAIEVTEEMMRSAVEDHESGDGSPFEAGAEHVVMTLDEALAANAATGPGGAELQITDSKTELILRRLYDALREGEL